MINALSVTPDSMNPALQRLHRIFAIVFGVVVFGAIIVGIIGAVTQLSSGSAHEVIGTLSVSVASALIFAPFFAAHWYAAKGAKLGKPYGRNISKVIAFIWLFGFPIGTLLALYVFPKTNAARWNKPEGDTSKDWLHTSD